MTIKVGEETYYSEEYIKELEERINKAIEFIENYNWYYLELKDTLLDILKGDNK